MRDVINAWLRQGDLVHLKPSLASDPIVRTMFVSMEIYDAVNDLQGGRDERMGRLRADLETFVRGDIITVAMDLACTQCVHISAFPIQR